jgi:hypothetical protein
MTVAVESTGMDKRQSNTDSEALYMQSKSALVGLNGES